MNINKLDSEDVAETAGKALNQLLFNNKGEPVLLMLSAGSAFKILDEIQQENMGPELTITVLDERFSLDPKVNNFSQLQKIPIYKIAEAAECNFIGTAVRPNETQAEFVARWEARLKDWKDKNPNGKIFATFGMGPDGHIAGIFPYADNEQLFKKLFLGNNWLTAYSATGKNQYPERVTTTPAFFRLIDAAVVYITGDEKKEAIKKFASKSAPLHELPAMVLWDIKNVEVFTDIA